MNMQKLMCSATKQVVHRIQSGILLGRAELAGFVGCKDTIAAFCLARLTCGGLTAAADAAVGAGHDLDKVEKLLAGLYLFNELVGIAQPVCNGDPERGVTGRDLEI